MSIPRNYRSVGFFWDLFVLSKVWRELKQDFPDKKYRVRLEIIEVLDGEAKKETET